MRFKLLVVILVFFASTLSGQIIPAKESFFEDRWRIDQLLDTSKVNSSFSIRPFILYSDPGFQKISSSSSLLFSKNSVTLKILPVTSNNQFNSHHPYGLNDGSMIPSKGYQQKLSAGIFSQWGPLTLQLQPELVYAQNNSFAGFSSYHTDSVWSTYYSMVLNLIDAPDRFGAGTYSKLLPGQSSLRFNYKKLSLGISTENLWWGPGVRNSLIMSNNAPGFEHITFNTISPLLTKIGSFEWQVIAGKLKNSNILPPETNRTLNGNILYREKMDSDRYLNGMIITYQPKWTKGLHLGFSRVFYQYSNNIPSSLNGYLPIFGAFFKGSSKDENNFGRDQMLTIFFRYILPKDHAEIYFEFGRNDHSQNISDLAMEPEHARAYLVGFKKLFKQNKGTNVELMAEVTQLQSPATTSVRESNTWYTHLQVRHGYTNRGQVIGAGIGPGSNSQTIGLNWFKPQKQYGALFERVVRNNDLYYALFAGKHNYESHWVDLSLNGHYTIVQNQFIYRANLSLIRSLNYQYRFDNGNPALLAEGKKNVNNLHAGLSVSYLF